MPARASAAATFTLAGKPRAASRAFPANTRSGIVTSIMSMPCCSRYGAPNSPDGGLRVSIVMLSIRPSAAARTASRPSNAPVGTMIRAPVSFARFTRCILGSNAPTEAGMKIRPDSIAGTAMRSNSAAGAASTTISASASSASPTMSAGPETPRGSLGP